MTRLTATLALLGQTTFGGRPAYPRRSRGRTSVVDAMTRLRQLASWSSRAQTEMAFHLISQPVVVQRRRASRHAFAQAGRDASGADVAERRGRRETSYVTSIGTALDAARGTARGKKAVDRPSVGAAH